MGEPSRPPTSLVRETLAFAVPTLATLIAEPVFLAADSVIVGHLGIAQLGALATASAILTLVTSSFIVLAYGTTSRVARLIGAGNAAGAFEVGVASTWAAVILGAILSAVLALFGREALVLLKTPSEVLPFAVVYLKISAIGVPFVLLSLAGIGVLRGVGNSRGPMQIQVAGYLLNIVLNLWLVWGVGLGIAGSALGTVLSQAALAAAYFVMVRKLARSRQVSLKPHLGGIANIFATGVSLIVRTVSFRIAILLATWVAESLGTVSLAAFGAAMTVWTVVVFVLDSVAIAAQVSFAKSVGAGRLQEARDATVTFMRLAVVFGLVTGAVLAAFAWVIPGAFVTDPTTRRLITNLLLIEAILQPLASLAFMLDGILIGVGDFTYLGFAAVASLGAFVPGALEVRYVFHNAQSLWIAIGIFMLARVATLASRIGQRDWLAWPNKGTK